jgi:hypothetical protein
VHRACLAVGSLVGLSVGLLAGLAHQSGFAGSAQGLVMGALSGPIVGALVMLMLAFGGKFLIRPAFVAGTLLGLAVGLIETWS